MNNILNKCKTRQSIPFVNLLYYIHNAIDGLQNKKQLKATFMLFWSVYWNKWSYFLFFRISLYREAGIEPPEPILFNHIDIYLRRWELACVVFLSATVNFYLEVYVCQPPSLAASTIVFSNVNQTNFISHFNQIFNHRQTQMKDHITLQHNSFCSL